MRRWIAVVVVCAGCSGSSPATGPKAPVPEAAAWVAPELPELPPVDAGTLTWTAGGVADLDASGPLVVDDDRLVWAAHDGAVRAAPLGGGPATALARFHEVVALATGHDRVYVLTSSGLFALPRDGAPIGLAEVSYPAALAVGADAVYLADGDWIRAVPLDGGEPTTLARDAGEVSSLAVSDTHVFWTDGGYAPTPNSGRACMGRIRMAGDTREYPNNPCSSEQRYGAIKRVAIGGGKVQSRPRFYPRGVTVFDDHVYWADRDGEAVTRAGLDGSNVEVVLGGRGEALAIDATSMVVLSPSGLLVEVPAAGGSPWVKAGGRDGEALALTADAIYLSVPDTGLVRFPRGPSRATMIAVPGGKVEDLAVSGDHVYYIDAHFDDRDDAIMRVPRAGGAAELVRAHVGQAERIAVSGDHVVVYDAEWRTLSEGGPAFESDLTPDAIAADERAIYWLQDLYVRARPFAGGPVETYHQPDPNLEGGFGYGGGRPPASLSVRDGVIVASNLTLAGVAKIDTRPAKGKTKGKAKAGPKITYVAEGAVDGAAAGDQLVAWTERGLELHPGAKLLVPAGDAYQPDMIVADAREAWLLRAGELIRVPLDGSAPEVLMTGLYDARLALDADAAYVSVRNADAVIRVARVR